MENILTGWQAIADYLGYSISWCKARAKDKRDPLPIKYPGGTRKPAATTTELYDWIERQPAVRI